MEISNFGAVKFFRRYWYLPLFLLAAVLFWLYESYWHAGRSNTPAANETPPVPETKDPPDSLVTDFKDTVYPRMFEAAYFPGTKAFQSPDDSTYFEVFDMGRLNVESGKLIACDPIVMKDPVKAFVQKFPLGNFPVQLAIAKGNGDESVAFSRILFSDAPVARWAVALQPGEKPQSIRDARHYCYGVDAATGIYIDSSANAAFDAARWEDVFFAAYEKSFRPSWSHLLHQFGDHNLAAFSTGIGDGCFSVYIGYDARGNVCRLLTDFNLVAW